MFLGLLALFAGANLVVPWLFFFHALVLICQTSTASGQEKMTQKASEQLVEKIAHCGGYVDPIEKAS